MVLGGSWEGSSVLKVQESGKSNWLSLDTFHSQPEEVGTLINMSVKNLAWERSQSPQRNQGAATGRGWKVGSTPVFLPGDSQGLGEPGGLPSMGSHRVGHD